VLDACEYVENGTVLSSPRCENDGNCVNGTKLPPGSFECDCPLGYRGQFCEEGMTGHSPFYYTYIYLGRQLIDNVKAVYPQLLLLLIVLRFLLKILWYCSY